MLIESNLSKPSADRGLNVDHVAREADYLTAFKASYARPASNMTYTSKNSAYAGYSYVIKNGPGKSHDSPSRNRSRQFSQL